jgi:hypothetical protein
MMSELDHGVRCERHVGEVFPPRCGDCQAEARAADEATAPIRHGRFVPDSECPVHRGWPLLVTGGCERCATEAAA